MQGGFEISLRMREAQNRMPELIEATAKQLELAVGRALRKTGQWLRTHSVRELGRELGITQAPLRQRFKLYPRVEDGQVKVWVGLRPISVHYLGSPAQTVTGVRVGRQSYDGAFVNPMRSRHMLVWRRKGRERLPIERVTQEIAELGEAVVQRWETRVEARFIELFEQEVRYVLSSA
ncbi:phage tail protein [Spirulina subsalsa FACHB-351]|uniref:Phage tail protein n=1 Tax=Spirulina subsalsa FACHB-351 TaxID=234711 RepID=A0ABT3L783_9CYAN|nr:phage tail protein [Spirulina subsalsa]MCW6036820.1 phage tail protein [Spirulina subsalsa FACHB-351]